MSPIIKSRYYRAANREEELHQQQSNLQDIPAYSPRHHYYENPANASNASYGQQQQQRYSRSRAHPDEMNYKMNNGRMDDSQRIDMNQATNNGNSGGQSNGAGSGPTASALSMKERKKSLMTRLIPGRNAPSGKYFYYILLTDLKEEYIDGFRC